MKRLTDALLTAEGDERAGMLAELTDDELVHVLETVADAIDRLGRAYELRLALFQAARERDPKVTQKRLADAARVSEPFVIQTLRKAREAEAAAT